MTTAASSATATPDAQSWVWPPGGADVPPIAATSNIGPVSLGDTMILTWAPDTTPEINFSCWSQAGDQTTTLAALGASSPLKYVFASTANQTDTSDLVFCHFYFVPSNTGNTVTWQYNNEKADTPTTWSSDATTSSASASASSGTASAVSGSSTISTSTIPSSSGSAGSSSSATSVSEKSTSSGLSGGAKAGIGIGVAVLIVLLAALAFFFMARKRKQKKSWMQTQSTAGAQVHEMAPTYAQGRMDEKSGNAPMQAPAELAGHDMRYEAP